MSIKKHLVPPLLLLLLIAPGVGWALTGSVYDDALAAGWENWSWASVDFENAAPVHSGSHSIAVTCSGGWQGLYLHHPGVYTAGYTRLRFFIKGDARLKKW